MSLSPDQLAEIIATAVQVATAPLVARLAALEARDAVAGPAGPAGRDGKDGADGRDGKDGMNGRDGKDAAPGRDGKDGIDGKDGKDAAPGRDGKDGIDGKDGKDGTPGRDGKDGLNGKDGAPGRDATSQELRCEWLDERTFRFVWADGTVMPGSERKHALVIHRGIWDASRTYEAGDQVICRGSMWIAKTTTTQRPDDDGPAARDWQLSAKQGPKGERGAPGATGPAGKDGAPGRDLTQMDAEGRKW